MFIFKAITTNSAIGLLMASMMSSVTAAPLDLDWILNSPTNESNGSDHGCENSTSTADFCAGDLFGPTISRGSFKDSGGNIQQNQRAQFQLDASGNFVANAQGGGQWYWHLITGDPNTGFAQEVIIEGRGAPGELTNSTGTISRSGGIIENAGSGGPGNGNDPLAGIWQLNATDTGTGTAHPRKVIVRQLNQDAEMTMEFRKGIAADGTFQSFTTKPVISQTIANSELTAQMTIDMSSLNYNQMNTVAPVVNTLVFTDPLAAAANFDMSTDAQTSEVTAGRYIFVDGGIQNSALEGFYFYSDGGGYDVWGVSGLSFRNDAENDGPYNIPTETYPATDPFAGKPLVP